MSKFWKRSAVLILSAALIAGFSGCGNGAASSGGDQSSSSKEPSKAAVGGYAASEVELPDGFVPQSMTVSPQGVLEVYGSNGTGQAAAYQVNADGKAEALSLEWAALLPAESTGEALRRVRWSFDSSAAYLFIQAPDRGGIYRAEGGTLTDVTPEVPESLSETTVGSSGEFETQDFFVLPDGGLVLTQESGPAAVFNADGSLRFFIGKDPDFTAATDNFLAQVEQSLEDEELSGPQLVFYDLDTGDKHGAIPLEDPALLVQTRLAPATEGRIAYFSDAGIHTAIPGRDRLRQAAESGEISDVYINFISYDFTMTGDGNFWILSSSAKENGKNKLIRLSYSDEAEG